MSKRCLPQPRVVAAVAAAAAVLVAATGCGSSESGGSTSGGSSGGEATIGVVVPLSGPDATLGEPIVNGVKLAVREAEQAGGLPGKVTVVAEDDQEKPEVGATLARKLCGKADTIAVVGDLASSVTLGTQPVYNGCDLAQITPSASNDDLTAKGYDQFFRTTAKTSAEAEGGAKYLEEQLPEIKTIATIDGNDATTSALANAFKEEVAKRSATVVAQEHITSGATDFRGVLTKLIAERPDALYLSLFYNDAALITKQARELGYRGAIIGIDAVVTPDFVKLAGPKAAEGVYLTNLGYDPTTTPSAKAFTTSYKQAYGSEPNTYAANAYDAAKVVLAAWTATGGGTDRVKVAEEIARTQIDGTQGTVAFDERGDLSEPKIGMFQVTDGQIRFIGPAL